MVSLDGPSPEAVLAAFLEAGLQVRASWIAYEREDHDGSTTGYGALAICRTRAIVPFVRDASSTCSKRKRWSDSADFAQTGVDDALGEDPPGSDIHRCFLGPDRL